MGDKEKIGGVNEASFLRLMNELGLWGKEKDQHNQAMF